VADELDKIAEGKPPYRQAYQGDTMRIWHEQLADFFILNPTATIAEAAEAFGMSEVTISRVKNSDMFKMHMGQRRERFSSMVEGSALERLQGKLANTAEMALDVLREKIVEQRSILGIDAVKDTVDMTLKNLGFAAPRSGQTSKTEVHVHVTASELEESRALMRKRMEAPTLDQIALPHK
jgi:hypothetical protein